METEYIPDKITYHPEEEICRLLAADDWRGMELMFRVYYKRLVVWADTFLEDMQLAEDIVQELFITLWEKKRRRTLQSSTLSSFLFVSVRNQCYHRLEKKDTLRHTVDLKEVNIAFEEYNEKHDYIITRIEIPGGSRKISYFLIYSKNFVRQCCPQIERTIGHRRPNCFFISFPN